MASSPKWFFACCNSLLSSKPEIYQFFHFVFSSLYLLFGCCHWPYLEQIKGMYLQLSKLELWTRDVSVFPLKSSILGSAVVCLLSICEKEIKEAWIYKQFNNGASSAQDMYSIMEWSLIADITSNEHWIQVVCNLNNTRWILELFWELALFDDVVFC